MAQGRLGLERVVGRDEEDVARRRRPREGEAKCPRHILRIVGKEALTGLALGIVNQIFEAETLERFAEMVQEYARQFTTPNKAAHAVGRIKRAVQTGSEIPFEQALALERELQQQLFQSEDAKEGLDAYVNKRKPEFKGR